MFTNFHLTCKGERSGGGECSSASSFSKCLQKAGLDQEKIQEPRIQPGYLSWVGETQSPQLLSQKPGLPTWSAGVPRVMLSAVPRSCPLLKAFWKMFPGEGRGFPHGRQGPHHLKHHHHLPVRNGRKLSSVAELGIEPRHSNMRSWHFNHPSTPVLIVLTWNMHCFYHFRLESSLLCKRTLNNIIHQFDCFEMNTLCVLAVRFWLL